MTTKYKGKPITKQLVRDALKEEIIYPSGHDIMPSNYYEKYFDVSHLVHTFKSDGTHKGTIFVNGEPVDELKGVYNLNFVDWLAGMIGLTYRDYGSYGGRGFQAQAIVRSITSWANDPDFKFVTQEEYDAKQDNNG